MNDVRIPVRPANTSPVQSPLTHAAITQPNRVVGIDALRGIAALGVATFHIYSQNLSPGARELFPTAAHLAIIWGRWGVQLFFVISGFVIAYTLYDRKNFDRAIDLPLYFARRIVRLDTLYLAVLGLYVALRILVESWTSEISPESMPTFEFSFPTVIKNIFYFLPIDANLWIPVAWTLAIEVQFYVAMGAFVIIINMNGLSRHAVRLTTVLAFLSLAYPLRLIDVKIDYWLFPHLFNLLAGSLLYFLFFQRSRFVTTTNALFALALVAIYFATRENQVLATLLSYIAVFATLSVVPARIAGHPLSIFLGERSYGIYLIHQPVGLAFVTPLIGLPFLSWGPVPLVIGLVVTIAIAHMLYASVERPSIKLSKKIGRQSR